MPHDPKLYPSRVWKRLTNGTHGGSDNVYMKYTGRSLSETYSTDYARRRESAGQPRSRMWAHVLKLGGMSLYNSGRGLHALFCHLFFLDRCYCVLRRCRRLGLLIQATHHAMNRVCTVHLSTNNLAVSIVEGAHAASFQ